MTDSWPALQTSALLEGPREVETRGTGPNSSSKLAVVKDSLLTFTYFWTPVCKHFPGHFGCAPSQCASPSLQTVAAVLRCIDSVLMAEQAVPEGEEPRREARCHVNKLQLKDFLLLLASCWLYSARQEGWCS